jgi:hypothetical protein
MRQSLREQVHELERRIDHLRAELESERRISKRLEKRYEALANGITHVCPRDRWFMMRFHDTNHDPDLYDVYNGFLYAFGRTIEATGTVFTRLSCPWELPEERRS